MEVKGRGDIGSGVLMIGEKPGAEELKRGKVWCGRAGAELDRLAWKTGIDLDGLWLDNLLADAPTGDDWSVTDADIERNKAHIDAVLAHGFHTIITLGAVATRYFLGVGQSDVRSDIGTVHGILHNIDGVNVLPCYHPAAGLHDSDAYPYIMHDFQLVSALLKGRWEGEDREDKVSAPVYTVLSNSDRDLRMLELLFERQEYSHIFIDTEEKGWCLTFALEEGEGYMIRGHSKEAIERLAYLVGVNSLTAVLHYAPHDIPVLRSMGWDLVLDGIPIEDTMIAAYVLQIEPQGLKALAYRHCGMEMDSYIGLMEPYSLEQRLDYLLAINEVDWGKPEPYVTEKKNEAKLTQPQGLNRRIDAVIKKMEGGEEVDIWKWWHDLHEHVKGPAVGAFGDLPTATMDDIPFNIALRYACRDADATCRVHRRLTAKMQMMGVLDTYHTDCSILPHVEEMVTTGFGVDVEHFKKLITDWRAEQGRIRHKIARLIGRYINPESAAQVRELLFEERGLPVYKETETGLASTADKAIDWLKTSDRIAKEDRDLIFDIGYHRELDKGVTSFAGPIIQFAGTSDDGRLHTNLKYTRVVSGRLSASDPNLLAMPTRTALGKLIRSGFVARDGHTLGSWDLNQIEMRFMAHESEDPDLIDVYMRGGDVHKETACSMFDFSIEEVTDEHRDVAKRVSFGVITGITGSGLKDQFYLNGITKYTEEDCDEFIRRWFRARPRVAEYLERCRAEARRLGYVRESIGGRIRYLQSIHSTNKKIAAEAERASHSHKISGGAQAIMKKGMAAAWGVVEDLRREDGVSIRWLLQVHDDVILEFPDGYEEILNPLMLDALCNAVKLRVPVTAKGKFGKRWGGMK